MPPPKKLFVIIMKKIALAALTLLLADTALACTPLRPNVEYRNSQQSSIIVSPNKHFFLKLVPSKWAMEKGRMVKKRDSYGLAFEALPYGQMRQLWSYKHWDANGKPELYLSNDGMNLIEVNTSVQTSLKTNAVVTYKKGQKIQTYPISYFGVKTPIRNSCRTSSWVNQQVKKDMTIQTINGLR